MGSNFLVNRDDVNELEAGQNEATHALSSFPFLRQQDSARSMFQTHSKAIGKYATRDQGPQTYTHKCQSQFVWA